MVSINKGNIININTNYIKATLKVVKVKDGRVYYKVIDTNYYEDYNELKYENYSNLDIRIIKNSDNMKVINNNSE